MGWNVTRVPRGQPTRFCVAFWCTWTLPTPTLTLDGRDVVTRSVRRKKQDGDGTCRPDPDQLSMIDLCGTGWSTVWRAITPVRLAKPQEQKATFPVCTQLFGRGYTHQR
jgi:hypothetical protein